MDINLKLVGANHNIWCMKLNQFVNSNTDAPPVKSHRDCEMGKWLYSVGLSKYGQIKDITTLEKVHQQLHTLSQEIVNLKNSGNVNEARQKLFVLQDYSDQIIKLVNNVHNQIHV